jgi:hypothetical protein
VFVDLVTAYRMTCSLKRSDVIGGDGVHTVFCGRRGFPCQIRILSVHGHTNRCGCLFHFPHLKVRKDGFDVDDGLHLIKQSVLGDTLEEGGGLGDVQLQTSIILEDTFELRENLKHHTQLVLDVSIIGIRNRPVLGILRTQDPRGDVWES